MLKSGTPCTHEARARTPDSQIRFERCSSVSGRADQARSRQSSTAVHLRAKIEFPGRVNFVPANICVAFCKSSHHSAYRSGFVIWTLSATAREAVFCIAWEKLLIVNAASIGPISQFGRCAKLQVQHRDDEVMNVDCASGRCSISAERAIRRDEDLLPPAWLPAISLRFLSHLVAFHQLFLLRLHSPLL
jgi:hypothetical protein